MFDKFRLKEVLVEYKKRFVQQQWPNEKYKWEAVQCFQLNWDVNSDDFAQMLTKSLAQTANLLTSVNNFPARMITKFAEIAPEEVRSMYIELYDESKDLYERVASFKNKSNTLLERYGNGAAQHYQYENAIMTYLWLRYPDKYYIYKLSEVKAVSSELESDYRFKKGAYADNIRNFVAFYDEICAELQQDDELKNLLNSQLTSTCYADPELRTLTIDVGFFISRYWNKEEPGPKADEWWPTDYTPALTVEDWLELLTDKDVFNESSLEIMKRMKDYGGKATCTQLAVKYGETKNFYNSGSVALARRIVQKTGCPVIARDEENSRFWPVLYVGKNAAKDEEGSYVWKGLYREYISRQEELSVMRGKINMPGTIKNRLAHKRVLTCDFDELSENNLLNQILKTTVTLLLRNGKVQAKYKDDLKKKMLYFSNVEIIEPTGIKWSSIRFQRNNQTYRMLVSICQLIIEGILPIH